LRDRARFVEEVTGVALLDAGDAADLEEGDTRGELERQGLARLRHGGRGPGGTFPPPPPGPLRARPRPPCSCQRAASRLSPASSKWCARRAACAAAAGPWMVSKARAMAAGVPRRRSTSWVR